MIDVKQAAQSAVAYFGKLMTVHDVRLEEVELSDDERFWMVTLSALVPAQRTAPASQDETQVFTSSPLASLFQRDYERIYRIFTVDSSNGDVRSMKIRKVA